MNDIPGLDEAAIGRVVERFYDRVRRDAVLGPLFDTVVDDWPAHIRRLVDFWCSAALRSGTYRGNPMAMHQPLPAAISDFEHWLALWRSTARELLSPAAAAHLITLAERIGDSLMLGMGLKPRARDLGTPIISRPSDDS